MTRPASPQKSAAVQFESTLRKSLLRWYDAHRRDLPWRASRDPYRVWLSEIMLQQTRVNAVLEHYRGFLTRFPTVEALASAPMESVLAAWSGLGYYRRARMLHEAANTIVTAYDCEFPGSAAELRRLPGIGRYTAAAIASIVFDEPVAVVDGNVERVVSRMLGHIVSGEETWRTAQSWITKKRPGDFNQAMMELGATVCTPRAPQCPLCPVSSLCVSRGEVRSGKRPVPQNKRQVCFGLALRQGRVFVVQRPATSSLMPGMWELPELRSDESKAKPLCTVRHSITTTDYTVRVVPLVVRGNKHGRWVSGTELSAIPLTGLTRKILRKLDLPQRFV